MRISDGLGSKYHLKFNENKLLLIQVDLSKVVNIVFNETKRPTWKTLYQNKE